MNIELIKKFVVESSVDEFTEFLESTDLDHFSTIQEILESHIIQDDADKLQVLVESADIDLAVKAQYTLSSNYVVESEIKDCDTKLRLIQEDKSDIKKEYARRERDLHNTGMHNYKPSKPFTKASRNISDDPNVSKQVQSAYFKKLSDNNNTSDAFGYERLVSDLSKNSARNKKYRANYIKRKEAIQRANDELKSMRDAGAKNVNTTISNDSVKEVFNSLDKATEKLDTSEQTIQTGKLVGGVAIAVAASVGVLAVIKKLVSKAKSPEVKALEKEANELVEKAKEISRDAKDGKISQAIAAARVKMLNARVNKIKAKAEKVLAKQVKEVKESAEDYDDLMEFIESADLDDPDQVEIVESFLELMEEKESFINRMGEADKRRKDVINTNYKNLKEEFKFYSTHTKKDKVDDNFLEDLKKLEKSRNDFASASIEYGNIIKKDPAAVAGLNIGIAAGMLAALEATSRIVHSIAQKGDPAYAENIMKDAEELKQQASELRKQISSNKIKAAVVNAKIKMLDSKANALVNKAKKVAEKESKNMKESVEDDIRELESQIEDVDDNFSSAKKKLVEGLYTKDEFQDISDNHEEKLQKLRDKIDELKEKEE